MSVATLGSIGSAQGAGGLTGVLDSRLAGSGCASAVRTGARANSGFQRVLAREATAASRAATARERVARRQDASADPEGARVVNDAIASLLQRIGSDATPTTVPSGKSSALAQATSVKGALEQLWLQANGARSVADLATLALSGATSQTESAQDTYVCPITGQSVDLSQINVLLDLLKSLAGTASTTDTAASPTDLLNSLKTELQNLATVVMDAVQGYVDSKNGQPQTSAAADVLYVAQADGSSAAQDGNVVRLVGIDTTQGDVVTKLQTLLDRLQNGGERGAERRDTASAPDGSLGVGQVLVDGSAASARAATASDAASTAQTGRTHEAVAQVQAALADMLDRMQGNVSFDTDRMRAVIQLNPPALGRVHVDLNVDGAQRVHATFHAEDASTRDFLQQNQSDLRREFARQGYAPQDVEIAFDDAEPGAFALPAARSVRAA